MSEEFAAPKHRPPSWTKEHVVLYLGLAVAVLVVFADARESITAVAIFLGTAAGAFLVAGAVLALTSGKHRFGHPAALIGLPIALTNALYLDFVSLTVGLTIGVAAIGLAVVEFRKDGQ